MSIPTPFPIRGVCEGFYGRPWSTEERLECFALMKRVGMNTYMHAPKDDPYHRRMWRRPYPAPRVAALAEWIAGARARRIDFIYAIHPGLDIDFASRDDFARLVAKCQQVLGLGAHAIALLMDDIDPQLKGAAARRFSTIAAAHCDLANRLRAALGAVPFYFCPTEYCTAFAAQALKSPYLREIGERLDPAIHVFWTGPEVISEQLTRGHVAQVSAVLRRKVTIWDNLFATDYALNRAYLGPLAGRQAGIEEHVDGLLINPNTPYRLNFIAIYTTALYLRDPAAYRPRGAWREAAIAWVGRPMLPALSLIAGFHWTPSGSSRAAARYLARVRQVLLADGGDGDARRRLRAATKRHRSLLDKALAQAALDPRVLVELWPYIAEVEAALEEFLIRFDRAEAVDPGARRVLTQRLVQFNRHRFSDLQRLRAELLTDQAAEARSP